MPGVTLRAVSARVLVMESFIPHLGSVRPIAMLHLPLPVLVCQYRLRPMNKAAALGVAGVVARRGRRIRMILVNKTPPVALVARELGLSS